MCVCVCLLVFSLITSCNIYHFVLRVCKSCNENSIPIRNGERHCPADDELIERTFPDRSALTDIMNLKCFCLSVLEGCKWQGLLLYLEEHVESCEFCVQNPCPYHDFHCKFMGSRASIEQHLQDDYLKHDCLLAISLNGVLKVMEGNRTGLCRIKKDTVDFEKSFVKINHELLLVEEKLKGILQLVESEETNTHRMREQCNVFEELLSSGESKKSKFIAFHNKFKELVKNVDIQMAFVNDVDKNSDKNKEKGTATVKRPLVDKVKRLEESNKTHGKQIGDLGIKIRIFQCSSNDGNYTWKLDNLNTRLAEAKSGKVCELYTPPLYTSNFGYKYSAKVMLAGEIDRVANNNANHMAFYIVIMQGDFDEILEFPFPYPITITLMSTSNKANISHTLYPDPDKVHFQKPYKNMNPAIGFARFCPHNKLMSGGFIKNDAIYFKLTVEKTGIDVKEPSI